MRTIIATLLLAEPASAACWTATAPTEFCAAPAQNAVSYEWAKSDNVVIATTPTPRMTMAWGPNLSPVQVKVRGVSASGAKGQWSPLSDDIYIRPACGDDVDANGVVNANDWSKSVTTFIRGCQSLALQKQPGAEPIPCQ